MKRYLLIHEYYRQGFDIIGIFETEADCHNWFSENITAAHDYCPDEDFYTIYDTVEERIVFDLWKNSQ